MKATIFKAQIEFADIDNNVYADHSLTIPRHPLESDERLLIRIIAFALNAPTNSDHGELSFAKDLWNLDEPCLWQKDLTGETVHWIDVGTPDEKRLQRICARSQSVSVFSHSPETAEWWAHLAPKLSRIRNLSVWQIPFEQSERLSLLVQRSMKLHIAIQEGSLWVTDENHSVEISRIRLHPT